MRLLIGNLLVVVAILLMFIPTISSAHFSGDSEDHQAFPEFRASSDRKSEFRNRLRNLSSSFRAGVVKEIGLSNLEIETRAGQGLTIDVSEAKLIRIPNTAIALSEVSEGDKVWVHGELDGNVFVAKVVYDIAAGVQPAVKKGTVTAVNGDEVTIATKHNRQVTVNTSSNTKVIQDGEAIPASEIEIGSKVKVFGLLNKITDFFSAIFIKMK